jgi:hypothetical protein
MAVTLLTVVTATIMEERLTTAATRQAESTSSQKMMMAFEMAETHWKLGFTTGAAQRTRRRQIPARDVERLEREIAAAKRRFGLAADVPVMSRCEAGREGFWLHVNLGQRLFLSHQTFCTGSRTLHNRVPFQANPRSRLFGSVVSHPRNLRRWRVCRPIGVPDAPSVPQMRPSAAQASTRSIVTPSGLSVRGTPRVAA